MTLHTSDSTETLQTVKTTSASEIQHSAAGQDSIVIDAEERSLRAGLGELWRYRELFYFLVWRDIKIRYKQTVLGAAWAVLQPLFAMLLFTLFFGKLARVPSDGLPYPLFAYAGLVLWTFFANAITNSSNSLVGSTSLITKVYFPRLIIPAAAVTASLLDLGIACLLLVVLMIAYGQALSTAVLVAPLLVLLLTLLALGIGLWMAALNVRYRDVRYALPFLIQLWLFASPVIYPASLVPAKWRWLFALNPITGIIEGFRATIFGLPVNPLEIVLSVATTLVVLLGATITFRRVEETFADVI